MNMADTIVAKSDQLNADDLLAGPMTVVITKVALAAGDQPVTISFDGDGGKPYRPCLSMRRAIMHVWGADASTYVGRAMTLYRDAEVVFGALKVSGIRISHMSHLDQRVRFALTAKKGQKKAYSVEPMPAAAPEPQPHTPDALDKQAEATERLIARINACATVDALSEVARDSKISDWRLKLKAKRPDLDARIADAFAARYQTAAWPGRDAEDAAQPAPADPDDTFPLDRPMPEGGV